MFIIREELHVTNLAKARLARSYAHQKERQFQSPGFDPVKEASPQ
jgi:hypothetical protein